MAGSILAPMLVGTLVLVAPVLFQDAARVPRIEDARRLGSPEARAHPIQKLYRIRGVHLPAGVDRRDADGVAAFVQRLLAANADLVGPGPKGGTLDPPVVRDLGTATVVDLQQRYGDEEVLGGQVRLVFDAEGALTFVANRTFVDFSGLATDADMPREAAKEHVFARLALQRPDERVEDVRWLRSGIAFSGDLPRRVHVFTVDLAGSAGSLPWLASIDRGTGDLLELRAGWAGWQDVDGRTQVWDPNPLQAAEPVPSRLSGLFGNGRVDGIPARVHLFFNSGALEEPWSARHVFPFFDLDSGATHLVAYGAASLNAYHFVARAREHLETLGFGGLMTEPTRVYALDPGALFSLYNYANRHVRLLAGSVNDALDGDVVLHEWTHGLHQAIGGVGLFDVPFNLCNNCMPSELENAAQREGLADFGGASRQSDSHFADYSAFFHPGGALRHLDNSVTRGQYAATLNEYRNSLVWSGAFWDLRETLGSHVAERLAVQSVFHVLPTDDFDAALETCVVQADLDLYGRVHEDVIRRAFSLRKIYGLQPGYPWSSPFAMTDRVYADDADQTVAYSVPGASELRVTFDAYTRGWVSDDGTEADELHVLDGAGTDISGSPFHGKELRNATVVVPGDTVQVRVVSTPGDGNVAAGARIVNVAAADPGNQPPVPELAPIPVQDALIPLIVTFDAGPSWDPDGTIVARSLDPGDGSPVIHMDEGFPVATHIYQRDGLVPLTETKTFQAVLTVTDDSGESSQLVVPVTLHPEAEGLLAPRAPVPVGTGLVGGAWKQRWSSTGAAEHAAHGMALAPIDDVNGDLWPDLLVGAPGELWGCCTYGRTRVLSGTSGSSVHLTNTTSTSIASLGDVDGDTEPDVLHGSSPDNGAAIVRSIANGVLHQTTGPVDGSTLGESVAVLGDLDGDGIADFAAGAPYRFRWAGTAYVTVRSGASGGQLYRVDGVPDAQDQFGHAVAAVGDLDGDGYRELLVGVPDADQGSFARAGEVRLYSGIDGALLRTHPGAAAYDFLGTAVAGFGDVDGDGYEDYAASAVGVDGPGQATGAVTIWSGVSGAELRVHAGLEVGAQYGHVLAAAGDQDRDGVDDYAIGVPGARGGGAVHLRSGATGELLEILEAPGGVERSFGAALALLGDVTGEGLPEIAIGAPQAGGDTRPGKVVVLGFDPWLTADATTLSAATGGTWTLELDFPGSQAGRDYVVLASEGRGPSHWDGLSVPLTQDALFLDTVAGSWPFAVSGETGTLDGAGHATTVVTFAPGDLLPWVGSRLYLAAISLDGSGQGAKASAFVRLDVTP